MTIKLTEDYRDCDCRVMRPYDWQLNEIAPVLLHVAADPEVSAAATAADYPAMR